MKATEYCINVFDGTHDTPKPQKTGYKLLTSKNIMDGYLDKSDAYFISKEDYEFINMRSQVHKWDVLFSMIGTVGNVCIVEDDEVDYAIKNMGVFSCLDEWKAKWLYFYLQSPYIKKINNNYLNGAIQKFLPLGRLRDLPIVALDSSKLEITKFLWNIQEKIKINNRINDNLQQLAENYFDRWFLQFDFPVNNKPYKSSGGMMIYNEILKTNIPSNWEVINIKSICELIWGQCPDGKNILNLNDDTANTLLYCSGAGDMRNGLVVDCQARTNASKREAEAGDILMSVAGSIGALCICDKHISLGRAAVAFRTNKDYLAFCYFMIKKYINRMLSVSSGSIQKVVNDSHIDDINFAFNKEIINDFTFVNDIINKCVLLAKENSELIKLRNELLPLLMNGQVSIV